jgi:transposase
MLVKRGHGIKVVEDVLESASLRTLVAIYGSRVQLSKCRSSFEVMLVYQEYLFEEFRVVYILTTSDKIRKSILKRLILYRYNIDNGLYILPSEVLEELELLRQYKNTLKEPSSCCLT